MKWAIAICLLVTTALSGAGQVVPEKSKLPDYYPLKVGTKWTFAVDQGTGLKVQVTNQIAKLETIDGKALAVQQTVVDGKITATEHLASTPQGVFRYRMNGIVMKPPACILKYPVKEGERWEAATTAGNQRVILEFEAGKSEEVTTPAGRYKTVSVMGTASEGGTKIGSTCWYAPNVGIVKQRTDSAGKQIHVELVKFEPVK
jgi:hypothetical protein